MGHYTGHAFHLRFKADAPEAVIEQVRQVACIKEKPEEAVIPMASGTGLVETHDAVKEMLADISYLMCGRSEYMKTWYGIRELTQDAEGRWCLQTKGSSKNSEQESVANFLTSLLPYLDVQEGDVLWRSIYESGQTENIFYFTDGSIKYGEYLGYWYYDEMDDDEHPYGDVVDFNWNPPLNFDRLQRLVALKKAWHKLSGHSNESWDVEKANGSLESFDLTKVKHVVQGAQRGRDPIFEINLCPEMPLVDTHGLPIRADITLWWNPPFGPKVYRGPTADFDGDTLNGELPLSMQIDRFVCLPYRGRNGHVRTQQYSRCIMQTRYNEGRKHSEDEALCKGTARVRPARRRLLDRLARYQARVK